MKGYLFCFFILSISTSGLSQVKDGEVYRPVTKYITHFETESLFEGNSSTTHKLKKDDPLLVVINNGFIVLVFESNIGYFEITESKELYEKGDKSIYFQTEAIDKKKTIFRFYTEEKFFTMKFNGQSDITGESISYHYKDQPCN